MIRFEVTGETWKEILEKLDGMIIHSDTTHIGGVLDTVEKPKDSFKTTMTSFEKDDSIVKNIVEESDKLEAAVIKKPVGRPPAVATGLLQSSGAAIDRYKLPFGELDSANQPFDKKIHARTKTKTEDGRWRLKRKTGGFANRDDSKPLPVQTEEIPTIPTAAERARGVTSHTPTPPPAIPDFTTKPPVDTQPPAAVIDTQQKMIAYLTKINETGKADYTKIAEYFTTQGIVNVLQVPAEKLPEVAENLKIKFGVDY